MIMLHSKTENGEKNKTKQNFYGHNYKLMLKKKIKIKARDAECDS